MREIFSQFHNNSYGFRHDSHTHKNFAPLCENDNKIFPRVYECVHSNKSLPHCVYYDNTPLFLVFSRPNNSKMYALLPFLQGNMILARFSYCYGNKIFPLHTHHCGNILLVFPCDVHNKPFPLVLHRDESSKILCLALSHD